MKAKEFKTAQTANAAVKRNGLKGMNYELRQYPSSSKFFAHFWCATREDVYELHARGFSAEYAPDKAA